MRERHIRGFGGDASQSPGTERFKNMLGTGVKWHSGAWPTLGGTYLRNVV